MSDTPETDAAWHSLHTGNTQPSWWVVAEKMRDHCRKLEQERDQLKQLLAADSQNVDAYLGVCIERDEAREAFKIVYNERVQMELERNEWKNKAYSHATDYTLMEAKCFRLEQQLKEYDKLKS